MVDDPVAALERELVAAARRRRDAALAAIARRSSRTLGAALAFAVSAGVVIAVGAAIVLAGASGDRRPGTRSSAAGGGSVTGLGQLAIFRRPQAAADRSPKVVRAPDRPVARTSP